MLTTATSAARNDHNKMIAADVAHLSWAAEQLGIGVSTAYRLAAAGEIPGAFKVGAQWRVSVPKFLRTVHGGDS
jgi:excisionase family DNA binding protein